MSISSFIDQLFKFQHSKAYLSMYAKAIFCVNSKVPCEIPLKKITRILKDTYLYCEVNV